MKIGRKYGEKEKIQILIKSLIFCILRIYIFSFYAFLFFRSLADAECLFPHAEIFEDVSEHFIGVDGAAGDFGEIVEAVVEVDAYEVGGGGIGEGLLHTADSCEGGGQGVVVAYIADDDIVGVALRP